jgi:DNA polymerase eta
MRSSSPANYRDRSPTRTSQFTYRHLTQLGTSSPASPLRVIAHIDLDAFYAQCEMRRLDVPDDQPLAVQQW